MILIFFHEGDGIFQNNKAPMHTAHVSKNWYEEHESKLHRSHGVASTIIRCQHY